MPTYASLAVAGLCKSSSLFRDKRDIKVSVEQLHSLVAANKPF